ncbi:DUF1828 domain-containing protein [Aurantimonas coralicida]|uniref:DUF1828 domain-containing protein n=1 Tax=Aurantimonas coralicida TaxID=182270 RepID=UPI001E48DCC1|nr:DUF1828 domain-containing protein [Aurantimonas coralicida]MCD1645697.1 DUF1828 domain-containing protein [Aurantimonas coralicida]
MSLKQRICQAFCEGVEVRPFDGGMGISTLYVDRFGDRIGMYALGPTGGHYRLVDNALTVAVLEAEGAAMDTPTRQAALNGLLGEYGAVYDEDMGELAVEQVSEDALPKAVLNFSALLLRLNDLLLLTAERVENTFKEDVRALLRDELGGRVRIKEDEPVSSELQEVTPDMVFLPEGRDPVALFIASSEPRIWQAMHLRLTADYEAKIPLSVVAILEADNSVSQKVRTQADNRLDAMPRFKDDQKAAINRVVTTVIGRQPTVH